MNFVLSKYQGPKTKQYGRWSRDDCSNFSFSNSKQKLNGFSMLSQKVPSILACLVRLGILVVKFRVSRIVGLEREAKIEGVV